MEPKNNKIIRNFISDEEVVKIMEWVECIDHTMKTDYHHMVELVKVLKGKSYIYDISRTQQTEFVTRKQSGNDTLSTSLPSIFHDLIDRIGKTLRIPIDNTYLQIVDMNEGGAIKAHYDIGMEGFINYKCNISVVSEEYELNVGNDLMHVQQKDLYSFEASLYRHWTEKVFSSRRVLLSYGFLVPYEKLGRSKEDPRVRLSRRIEKYFQ